MVFLGPNELSVIERCPYYRSIGKDRLDCTSFDLHINFFYIKKCFQFLLQLVLYLSQGDTKAMPMKNFRTDRNSYSPTQTRDAGSDMKTFG